MKTSHSRAESSSPEIASNLSAERCVLGAVIADDSLLADVIASGLKSPDFSLSAHRRIFQSAVKLRERNVPVDIVTVAEVLDNPPDLVALMADSIQGVVLEKNHILHHARIVRHKALLRRIQKFAEWLMLAASGSTEPLSLLAEARQKLEAYSDGETRA